MSHYRPKDGKDGIPGTHGKDGGRGPIGPMPEHEWIGTNLRFQEPSGEWGEFVDLEGPKGLQGEPGKDGRDGADGANGKDGSRGPKGDKGDDGEDGTNGARGPVGPMPEHQWDGTRLRFEESDGEWGKYVDLRGPQGERGASGSNGPQGPQGEPGGPANLAAGDGIELDTDTSGVTTVSFNPSTAEVPHLPGATYTTLQKLLDVLLSPGIITGGDITALNPTTTRVLAGTAFIRIADDNVSELRMCNFSQTDFAVPDIQTTHFYALDYSGGTPVVVQATSDTWDRDTQIPMGSAFRLDGVMNVTSNAYRVGDVITNFIQRADAVGPVLRDASVGGLILGNVATRRATVTAGRLWSRVSDFTVPAKNSTVDTMFSAYFNGVNLTVTGGLTQWDNLNFNNMGTGSLVAMGNNKFASIWFFMSFDGTKYGFAYGTAEHNTVGAAANEGPPAYLTQNFYNQALLIGRYIFEKGVDTPVSIQSAFTDVLGITSINDHNQLSGIQDAPNPVVGQHVHLSSAQAADQAAMTLLGAGMVAKTGVGTYAARTITQPAAGITVTNGNGVAGNPTLALANDLAALEGLGATGFAVRTAADTWAQRSFPNGTGFTWTNPAGIAGDPTLILSANLQAWSALATTDKENTITAGTTAQFWRGDKTFTNTLTGPVTLTSLNDAVNPSGVTVNGFSSGYGIFGVANNGRVGIVNQQTTDTLIDIDPMPADGTSTGQFRFFRNTNTTGATRFAVFLGNATATENHRLAGKGTNSYLCADNGNLGVGTNNPTAGKLVVAGNYAPSTDNTFSSGTASNRHSVVYAGTGTINTSDAREKSQPRDMTPTELAAASDLAKLPCIFQWLAMIAEKGEEGARLHCGPTVQAVITVMESHGLDPFRYGLVCYDQWEEIPEQWEVTPAVPAVIDEETGDVIVPEQPERRELIQEYRASGDRYGLRPTELSWFVMRGQEQRISALENLL
jgi:hypothetical protein